MEPEQFEGAVCRIFCCPLPVSRKYFCRFFSATFPKFFASELPDWQCRVTQKRKQVTHRCCCKVGPRVGVTSRERDSPDSPMGPVASLIAEVYFAMLDDRVVPVGNVKCSIRPHRSIDGTERYPLSGDNLRLLATDVAASVGLRCEAADAMAAEVIGHKVTDPFRRNMRAGKHGKSAVLGAARVEPFEPSLCAR